MAELESLRKEETTHQEDDSSLSEVEEDRGEVKRGQWANRVEFFLAIVGYTVGIGSIWRFPILCAKNGGGAFLIPFTFFMVTCGGPLYYLEVCLGQFCGKSATAAFEYCPLFKGLGYLMVILSFVVAWYGMIILGWVFYFLYNSFSKTLPWTTCDNWWNTPACSDVRGVDMKYIITTPNSSGLVNSSYAMAASTNNTAILNHQTASAAQEFWQYNVLRKSAGLEDIGSPQIHLIICQFLGYAFVVGSVINGTKSLGKVVYVTATMPYVLLTIVFIRGLTLDGAVDGIKYFLRPDFTVLANTEIWIEAAIQVFYSLGPTWGGVITMASYNKFHQKSVWETAICVFADEFSAVYSGLVVFTIIGFMAKDVGMSVAEVASASGPGLAFIAYPAAVSRLPLPQVWAVLFFLMMITVAFDSFFGMFETVTSGIIDLFPKQLMKWRILVNVVTGLVMCLLGIVLTTNGGIYIFKLLDWYSSAFALIVGSALEAITVCWIYGTDRFSKDIEMMTGRQVSVFLRVLWSIVLPGFLIIVFVVMTVGYSEPSYGDGYKFSGGAVGFGIFIGLLPIAAVFVAAGREIICTQGSLPKRLRTLLKPSENWGPRERRHMDEYKHNPYRYTGSVCNKIHVNVRGDKETPFF